jgi:PAS domain S-box-containing protein
MAGPLSNLRPTLSRPIVAWTLALAGSFALVAARLALVPIMGAQFPFAFLFIWVLLTSWWWGLRVGLASAGVAYAATVYLLVLPGTGATITPAQERVGLAVVAVTFLVCVWIGSRSERHRRLAEQAGDLPARLAENQVRLRDITDAMPALISVIGKDLRYQFLNHAYEVWFGVRRGEIVGKTMDEVLGEGAVQRLRPYIDRALAGETVNFEVQAPYRHGPARWIDATYLPARDAAGAVTGFYVMVHDVTARKHAEDALRESEQRFKNMADTAPALLWVTEADGRCSFMSRGWYDFTGQPEGQALGFGWLEMVHPDDRERAEQVFREANLARAPFSLDYRLQTPGGYRWAIDSARPRFAGGEGGEFLGYIGSVIDAHERKLAEESLRQNEDQLRRAARELECHKERLEELVLDRSLELERSHEQLRRSERMAALGTFAAGLGHDLHNSLLPLRVHIEELSRAARQSPATPGMAESVGAISSIVGYLGSLSRGMRLFSRDAAQDSEQSETDLQAWKLDAGRFLQASVPKDIAVTCEVDPAVPPVALAPHRLSQAVLNLVTNAGDAIIAARGPAAQGTIRIAAVPAADAPGTEGGAAWVRLTVTDDGTGMSEDVRRRSMEPYFTTKARGQGGTGMGLSMVFGIVSNAGGSMEIHSRLGMGTTVELVLPAARQPAATGGIGVRGLGHISVKDPRSAAYLSVVLEAVGLRAIHDAPAISDASDLWITDVAYSTADKVAAYRQAHPGAKVVVIGGGADHAQAGALLAPAETPLSGLRSAVVSATRR